MPGLDGLALCERVRARASSSGPRGPAGRDGGYCYVVILTGHDSAEEAYAGICAGADDYLTKPLNGHELRLRLISAQRVTDMHRQLTPPAPGAQRDRRGPARPGAPRRADDAAQPAGPAGAPGPPRRERPALRPRLQPRRPRHRPLQERQRRRRARRGRRRAAPARRRPCSAGSGRPTGSTATAARSSSTSSRRRRRPPRTPPSSACARRWQSWRCRTTGRPGRARDAERRCRDEPRTARACRARCCSSRPTPRSTWPSSPVATGPARTAHRTTTRRLPASAGPARPSRRPASRARPGGQGPAARPAHRCSGCTTWAGRSVATSPTRSCRPGCGRAGRRWPSLQRGRARRRPSRAADRRAHPQGQQRHRRRDRARGRVQRAGGRTRRGPTATSWCSAPAAC